MSEAAPKPERYKSKWDEKGNFIWKDGTHFSLTSTSVGNEGDKK